jgi:hypothetical protein
MDQHPILGEWLSLSHIANRNRPDKLICSAWASPDLILTSTRVPIYLSQQETGGVSPVPMTWMISRSLHWYVDKVQKMRMTPNLKNIFVCYIRFARDNRLRQDWKASTRIESSWGNNTCRRWKKQFNHDLRIVSQFPDLATTPNVWLIKNIGYVNPPM